MLYNIKYIQYYIKMKNIRIIINYNHYYYNYKILFIIKILFYKIIIILFIFIIIFIIIYILVIIYYGY